MKKLSLIFAAAFLLSISTQASGRTSHESSNYATEIEEKVQLLPTYSKTSSYRRTNSGKITKKQNENPAE